MDRYKESGDIAEFILSNYYLTIYKDAIFPGQYYILGGQGMFEEANIFRSVASKIITASPAFIGLFSIMLARYLFFSDEAISSWKNVAASGVKERRFKLGIVIFYLSILLFMAAVVGCIALAQERTWILLERIDEGWRFVSTWRVWLPQYASCLLNTLTLGILNLAFARFFHKGSSYFFWAYSLTFAFILLSMMATYFSMEESAFYRLLSWTMWFGPNIPSRLTITKISIWILERTLLLIVSLVLILFKGPYHRNEDVFS